MEVSRTMISTLCYLAVLFASSATARLGATSWDILMPNVSIRHDTDTTYRCTLVKPPVITHKHHIIATEEIVEGGHSRFLHHLVVNLCHFPKELDVEAKLSFQLRGGSGCGDYVKYCHEVVAGWTLAKNLKVRDFPDDAGYPFTPQWKYMVAQLHYNNADHEEGITDSSGIRIWYTPTLRKYDTGTMHIGASIVPFNVIPPNLKRFLHIGHCTGDCTDAIPEAGIHVFAVTHHMHLLGRQMITRHFRKGQDLPLIRLDESYDFTHQDTHAVVPSRLILPGDEILVECYYNSSEKSTSTVGGGSTDDEMCMSIFSYYPKLSNLSWCLSRPQREDVLRALDVTSPVNGHHWFGTVRVGNRTTSIKEYLAMVNKDFWSTSRIDKLQQIQKTGRFEQICDGGGAAARKVTRREGGVYSSHRPYVIATAGNTGNIKGESIRSFSKTNVIYINALIFVVCFILYKFWQLQRKGHIQFR